MDKKSIRNTIRKELLKMSVKQHTQKSLMIHNKLINTIDIKEAKTIAVTISNFPEVNTKPLIEALWKIGKRVAVPRCIPKTKEMHFYIIENFEQLENVYMDLYEPIIEQTVYIKKSDIDVLIAPGIAFDNKGFRIGYGGGYYDRYLTDYKKKTISLAFELQIVDKIPINEYDLSICTIITEERFINCGNV